MNNSKIVSIKTTSAIFLATVLVDGTFALSFPSFIVGEAQAQPYYGMDNYQKSYVKDDRDKSKKDSSKSVSLNKINCINTNLNINGENAGNVNIANKDAAKDGGYVGGGYSSSDGSGDGYVGGGYSSSDGSGDGYDSNERHSDGYNNNKKDNGFDCIINNNNTNINTVVGVNDGVTPTPPTVELANLNVSKNVNCISNGGSPNDAAVCDYVEANISPSDYQMIVTGIGNNPNPSEFPGSSSGTNVQLGAGGYIITEEFPSFIQLQTDLRATAIINTVTVDDGLDCVPFFNQNNIFQNANGTISADESQICGLTNTIIVSGGTVPNAGLAAFDMNKDSSINFEAKDDNVGTLALSFSSPPTIAQGPEESSALEKIEKLKKQWLDLLP